MLFCLFHIHNDDDEEDNFLWPDVGNEVVLVLLLVLVMLLLLVLVLVMMTQSDDDATYLLWPDVGNEVVLVRPATPASLLAKYLLSSSSLSSFA